MNRIFGQEMIVNVPFLKLLSPLFRHYVQILGLNMD